MGQSGDIPICRWAEGNEGYYDFSGGLVDHVDYAVFTKTIAIAPLFTFQEFYISSEERA
jgi:hypothetical protein